MDLPSERYDFALFGGDPEYQTAATKGPAAVERFFREKLEQAEATGDQAYIFEAVYWLISNAYFPPEGTRSYIEGARRLLELPPADIQKPLYVARTLFEWHDEPGLALELVRHGYSAIKDAESAFGNLGYLIESKKLILAIEAALDPWSEETGRALYEVAMACAQPGEIDRELIESMKTITNRPTESWLESWMQKSILRSLWAKRSGEQRFIGTDHAESMKELERLHASVPDVPLPRGGMRQPE
jgi:hypothetical protein